MQWLFREKPAHFLVGSLWEMSGQALNVSAVARRMKVTRPTARARIRKLEREDLILLLPGLNGGRPLLYVKGTFAGAWVSRVIERIRESRPDASFFWWRTGRVRRISLISQVGGRRIGFQFSEDIIQNRTWWPLVIARHRGIIQRGYLLHAGTRAFSIRRDIYGLPLYLFTDRAEDWMFRFEDPREIMATIIRYNSKPFL